MSVLHHRSSGAGSLVVFLHGNPTSSYLVGGIVLMEGQLRPLPDRDSPDDVFRAIREPGVGERMSSTRTSTSTRCGRPAVAAPEERPGEIAAAVAAFTVP